MRRLVEHQRGIFTGQLRKTRRACRGARGQKALEQEAIGRQAADAERRSDGAGAWHGTHGQPLLLRGAHESIPGIGNQRGTGVGDERDAPAAADIVEHGIGAGPLIVLVQRLFRRADAVVIEQAGRHAGVLAIDHIGGSEGFEGAQGDVAQIADRGGDDIEAGRQRRRVERRAGDEIPGRPGCVAQWRSLMINEE